jgi:hypothetical protein
MKSKILVSLILAVVFQLSALALAAPHVRFKCQKKQSDSALILDIRNDGPDTLAKGTKIYYFYRTSPSAEAVSGTHTLDADEQKGGIFSVFLSVEWQKPIVECGCSLKPILLVPRAKVNANRRPE